MFDRERAWASQYKTGQKVRITTMNDPFGGRYAGKEGVIEHIDDAGQLHGTWGGCALTMEDTFEVIG